MSLGTMYYCMKKSIQGKVFFEGDILTIKFGTAAVVSFPLTHVEEFDMGDDDFDDSWKKLPPYGHFKVGDGKTWLLLEIKKDGFLLYRKNGLKGKPREISNVSYDQIKIKVDDEDLKCLEDIGGVVFTRAANKKEIAEFVKNLEEDIMNKSKTFFEEVEEMDKKIVEFFEGRKISLNMRNDEMKKLGWSNKDISKHLKACSKDLNTHANNAVTNSVTTVLAAVATSFEVLNFVNAACEGVIKLPVVGYNYLKDTKKTEVKKAA